MPFVEVIYVDMDGKVTAECDLCGKEIYEGEEYYRINGESVCSDCLETYAIRLLTPFRLRGGEV